MADTFASLLYKAEKPSVCPSVCLSVSRENLSGFCMDQIGTWFVHSRRECMCFKVSNSPLLGARALKRP